MTTLTRAKIPEHTRLSVEGVDAVKTALFLGLAVAAASVSVSHARDTRSYTYDAQGRLIVVVRGNSSSSSTTTYTYDDADNRTRRVISSSSGGGMAQTAPRPASGMAPTRSTAVGQQVQARSLTAVEHSP